MPALCGKQTSASLFRASEQHDRQITHVKSLFLRLQPEAEGEEGEEADEEQGEGPEGLGEQAAERALDEEDEDQQGGREDGQYGEGEAGT